MQKVLQEIQTFVGAPSPLFPQRTSSTSSIPTEPGWPAKKVTALERHLNEIEKSLSSGTTEQVRIFSTFNYVYNFYRFWAKKFKLD